MKTAALKNLRSKLIADLPVYGLWVTLESPSITEMAVALGVDRVVIDAEVTGVHSMNGSAGKEFVVALTADFFGPDGSPKYRDLGLSVFEGQSQIVRRTLAEHRPQIGCDLAGRVLRQPAARGILGTVL